ncbi:hypothetical protein R1sor_002018 [Riccia sorocarpa]|uniref:Galactose oxidase-like Early set domain-containing protein n=1 Tax=Riccia sorocarpa TaxID=122646 RepID=A0ABD3H1S4_9MARC
MRDGVTPKCQLLMIVLKLIFRTQLQTGPKKPYLLPFETGSQGWGNADNPALSPVEYDPYAAAGSRFTTMNPTTIPRIYHSTANLLPDGGALGQNVNILMNSPPYMTHSYSQGQRQLSLAVTAPMASVDGTTYTMTATSPPRAECAPPGWYMLFALNSGIPSSAVWMHIG